MCVQERGECPPPFLALHWHRALAMPPTAHGSLARCKANTEPGSARTEYHRHPQPQKATLSLKPELPLNTEGKKWLLKNMNNQGGLPSRFFLVCILYMSQPFMSVTNDDTEEKGQSGQWVDALPSVPSPVISKRKVTVGGTYASQAVEYKQWSWLCEGLHYVMHERRLRNFHEIANEM